MSQPGTWPAIGFGQAGMMSGSDSRVGSAIGSVCLVVLERFAPCVYCTNGLELVWSVQTQVSGCRGVSNLAWCVDHAAVEVHGPV